MSSLFKNRREAVECNANAARDAYLLAARFKEEGNEEMMRQALDWARQCDETATQFSRGDNDDVLEEYREG